MDKTDEDTPSVFVAQIISGNVIFPLIDRQRTHNMNCPKVALASVAAIVVGIGYGLSLPYGEHASWHVILALAGFFGLIVSIPVGIYGIMQRHHFEGINLALGKIIVTGS